ncbi:TAXI family TRAP transporter solute-binding subunit [Floridanema evergladense]|uniref:TAXI family TRAP transporter solute-binding subunit n=1 Tax=Floridaenema evergladense BLCC-F167 TaxID=3153639 RepID=A0ABV4WDP1_9CYAN
MKKLLRLSFVVLFTALMLILGNSVLEKSVTAQEVISILTAGNNSFYYQAATELQNSLKGSGFSLNIKESSGSSENLEQLGKGASDLAFAQQDAMLLLRNLTDQNLAQLANNINVFAPINNEAIHILVNPASNIKNVKDLAGKRVAVGPEKSGTYISAVLIYQISDLDVTAERIIPMEVSEGIEKVSKGELDAAFYTAVVGAPLLKQINAQQGKKLKLLAIDRQFFQENQKELGADTVSYSPTKIPAKTYPWQDQEVDTISTSSFLYINKSLEPQKAYNLAKAIYPKGATLKGKDTFWNEFSIAKAKSQVKAGLNYHPGVKKFLEES